MKYLVHSNYGVAGGHQSLHQLSSILTNNNQSAYMVYPPYGQTTTVDLWRNIYGVDQFLHREVILDEPDQVHILPANWGPNWYPCDANTPSCLTVRGDDPYKSKKVLYWLGVTPWQDWEIGGIEADVNLDHPNLKKMYHACQSQYVYDFLMNSGKIDPRTIFMLRDYTHEFYLHSDYELFCNAHKRGNIVLYNAVKGIEHTKQLIDICSDVNCIFVKIHNMTREQIKQLALIAKVYIDFGHHPGKDRIPREMATCGCIVITGNEGTAISDVDVPVGPRKFPRINGSYDYQSIKAQIKNDIENYMEAFLDEHQSTYRMRIRREKSESIGDVQNMLKVIESNVI